MNAKQKERVAQATVHIERMGGQGVLVPGNFIVTAAHCIRWDGRGGMALGDRFTETVKTKLGDTFRLGPCAVDPVSDLAFLGPLDNQVFGADCDAFEEWAQSTEPVPIARSMMPIREPIKVEILTHDRGWAEGTVTSYRASSPVSFLVASSGIRGGTSGGPVVHSRSGKLIGVVSNFGEAGGNPDGGMIPVINLAAPRWVWALITARRGEVV